MKNKLIISAVIAAALVLAVALHRSPDTTLGGITGGRNQISNPVSVINGLAESPVRKPLNTATTTPCAVQSPSSTSTLVFTSLQYTTSTSTDALTLQLATSSSAFATTTSHFQFALAAGALGTFNYTPTSTEKQVMAPNSWVVWGAKGTTPGSTANLNGTCSALFRTS